MTRGVPLGLARFDSATAMAQGLACRLHGRSFPVVSGPLANPVLAAVVNALPPSLRDAFYTLGGRFEAAPHGKAGTVDAEAVAAWIASLYPRRRFPAVAVGSSNGAFVHLCAAMGIPWLPQTVLTVIRRSGVHPDDPRRALAADGPTGALIARANPSVSVHHLHDPNQDRLMLKAMAYYRLKYRVLPPAYRAFLREALAPGGTILVCECTAAWPTTLAGERQVFQFGAFGGATVEEYFGGGERVHDYLRRYRSPWRSWDPPPPDSSSPEAEWGYEPALTEEIGDEARRMGARVLRVVFSDPESLSIPVAEAFRAWYREMGRSEGHLLAETFILMEPYLTLRLGAVPLWLVFNTEPSARLLRRYLEEAGPFDDIDLTLFSHGTEGVGVTPIPEWRALVGSARRRGSLVGVDPRHYPRDFATFNRYHADLRRRAMLDLPPPLAIARAEALLRQFGPAHGARVTQP